MGGIFGVVSSQDCVTDLFYGTDYHSHLGTQKGGMAALNGKRFSRSIHSIKNIQFRSKFEDDLPKLSGNMGIGCISNMEDQPLIIGSHLGNYAIIFSGKINNAKDLGQKALKKYKTHFSELSTGEINPTELLASLINQENTFADGIRRVQESVEGSASVLLLTEEGIYAARDQFGRSPLLIGEKENGYCVSVESCALPNLGYRFKYELGPAEIVLLTPDGIEIKKPAGDELKICSFMWIYYGFPASSYEGKNVEAVRYRCGAALAKADGKMDVDMVGAIPDSGTSHAIGYANESGLPYCRPFTKYTPTWPRSFTPRDQSVRNLVARMKLVPIREIIQGKRILFCDDSIVRGTQLKQTIQRLYDSGASELHMRPACPPLMFLCKYLNLTRSKSEMDLACRQAVNELEGRDDIPLDEYVSSDSEKYHEMIERIKTRLNLSSLKYQTLSDMVRAIGLDKRKLCTYCWDGCE